MTSTWVLKSKSAAELPQRLRMAALTANDREFSLEVAQIIAVVGVKRKLSIDDGGETEHTNHFSTIMKAMMLAFCQSMVVDVRFSKIQHYNPTLDDFPDHWILNNTRFHSRDDCKLAFLAMKLPQDGFILPNRARVSSEEAWLVTLYRSTFPRRLVDVVDVFGRDTTFWSRVIRVYELTVNPLDGLRFCGP